MLLACCLPKGIYFIADNVSPSTEPVGFCDVATGSKSQGLVYAFLIGAGCENNDRNRLDSVQSIAFPEKFHSAHEGHIHVNEYQIRLHLMTHKSPDRLFSVAGCKTMNRRTEIFQHAQEDFLIVEIIID